MDHDKITAAVREILIAIGEDPDREGLQGTPRRIADMYAEIFAGLTQDPREVLQVGFEEGHQEMVIVKDIPFYSVCEHHLVPFFGKAHVGYIPNGRVVGISKLARATEILARRPQLQERLTTQLADALMSTLEPHGVGVVIEAEHLCYDRETEILTPLGWVRFDQLQVSTPVAQVDPRDLTMSFVVPSAYVHYPYKGPMQRWQSLTLDLLVTPDHRIVMQSEWIFENTDEQPWQIVSSQELPARFYVPQAVRWLAPDRETVQFADEELSGDDYVRFMGAWISEGCTREGHHDVIISQDEGEYANMIWELLQRLPFGFRKTFQGEKRPNHIHFRSSDRRLYDALRVFGKSGDKRVPNAIKQMSARQIELFLLWYGLGDGHNVPSRPLRWHYVSKSHGLIDDVQELLLRTGKTGAVQTYENCSRMETRVHKQQSGKDYKWYSKVQPEHRSIVDFDDEVFCVSVPTGALLVRRNGRPLVSGNCMTMRGVKKPGSSTVTSGMRGVFKETATRAEFMSLIR